MEGAKCSKEEWRAALRCAGGENYTVLASAPAWSWKKGRRKESLCFSQCMAGQEKQGEEEGEVLFNVCILRNPQTETSI